MKALVVDDDNNGQKVLCKVLESRGYEVHLAGDGEEALGCARDLKPDVVFSDVMMPRVDGFQMCKKFREDPILHDIPVVLASAAFCERRDQELAKEVGASLYLEKPLRPRDIVAALARLDIQADEKEQPKTALPESSLSALEFAEKHSERLASKLQEYALEVTRAHEKLKRLDEAKDTFVSIASHELRTPIAVLHGYCQLLRLNSDQSLNEDQVEFVLAMEQAVSRLSHITQKLLEMSQLENEDGLDIPREKLDLAEICSSVVNELRPFCRARMLDVSVTSMDTDATMYGIPWSIRQCVVELLQNAIRFTPDGGRIELSLQRGPDGLTLKVTDSGIGVPAEERERVFQKFYEVGGADKHSTGDFGFMAGGLGLGLSMVKAVVRDHGGEIHIEDRPDGGQGSVVRLDFPRNQRLKERD